MSSPDRRVVLDASAVVAWILQERGAQTVNRILPVSVLPASAMTESLYRARERGSRLSASQLHEAVMGMGVEVEPVTDSDTIRAAELIEASRQARREPSDSRLSLGDGLCIAVGERLQLPITGGDMHWRTLSLTVAFHPFR